MKWATGLPGSGDGSDQGTTRTGSSGPHSADQSASISIIRAQIAASRKQNGVSDGNEDCSDDSCAGCEGDGGLVCVDRIQIQPVERRGRRSELGVGFAQ